MSGLFGGAKMPAIKDPTPLPDEEQTTAARRRRLASEAKKSGPQATVLTSGQKETLG